MTGREGRICVGVITAPHGVRGAVRIKSFTASPEDVARYGPLEDETGGRRFTLSLVGEGKGVVLAKISGVADRNQVEQLRGLRLYLPRSALPAPQEDEYYQADLIGLEAEFEDGTLAGRVRAVHDFGAGDVLELEVHGQPSVLVPFTRAIVPVVDLEHRRLVVVPPPGLFAPASGEKEPA